MRILSTSPSSVPHRSFREEIACRIADGQYHNFIFIVPTGAFARQEIDRIYAATETSLPTPYICSLQDFVSSLHSALSPYRRVISDAESAALLEAALIELFNESELFYLERHNDRGSTMPLRPGTFNDVAAAIKRLQQKGVSPERLEKDIRSRPASTETLRITDILTIYKRYRNKLGETLIDQYGLADRLVSEFQLPDHHSDKQTEFINLFRTVYPKVTDIFIELFIEIDEPLRLVVNAAKDCVRIHQYIESGDNSSLFSIQSRVAEKQIRAGYQYVTKENEIFETTDSALISYLKKNLFVRRTERSQPFDASDSITVMQANTLREEAEFVAHRIKQIILSESIDYSPSRICVAAYRQEGISEIYSQVFEDFGIPYITSERFMLNTAPLFIALDSFFRLAEFGLTVNELLRFLTSPYFKLTDASGDPVDITNLMEMISLVPLPEFQYEWYNDIEEYQKSISGSFDDEIEARQHEKQIAICTKGKSDLLVIEGLLKRFNRESTTVECVTEIRKLLKDLAVKEQLLSDTDPLISFGGLEFDTRSYQLFDELLDDLLALSRSLGIDSQPQKFTEHVERLRVGAQTKRFAPRIEPGSGVMLASFDQIAGYTFDHLFIVNCNDTVFPPNYKHPVTELQNYLTTENKFITKQRFSFYQLLQRFEKHLTISWVQRGDDDAENNPSPFIESLLRILRVNQYSPSLNINIYSTTQYIVESTASDIPPDTSADSITPALHYWTDIYQPFIQDAIHQRLQSQVSIYNGHIDAAELTDEEREYFLALRTNKIFSVSQLERYAACPFKYLCQYILYVNEETSLQTDEGLQSGERGSIIHSVLQYMLTDIKNSNIDLHTMDVTQFLEYDHYSRKYYSDNSVYRNPFWRIDLESVFRNDHSDSILAQFFEAERMNSGTTVPEYIEAETETIIKQKNGDDPHASFTLKAKIDRIDVDSKSKIFTVIDYKSGTPPHHTEIVSGTSLQLPLYLRAAEDILRQNFGDVMTGVAGFYHRISSSENVKKPAILLKEYAEKVYNSKTSSSLIISLSSHQELADLIERTIEYANKYINGIQAGHFPLAAEERQEKVCKNCSYSKVCRLNESKKLSI